MAKSDVNSVTVVGRLTRDAELRHTSGGMALCRFSIASNYTRKQGDQYVEEVNYFDVVMFGRYAEAIHQYLTKGQQVVVSGEARQNRWEKDGQKRSKIEFIGNTVQLVGGRSSGESRQQSSSPSDEFSDDVPF